MLWGHLIYWENRNMFVAVSKDSALWLLALISLLHLTSLGRLLFKLLAQTPFFFFKKKKSFFVYFLLVVLVFAFVGETMDSSCTKERDVLGVIAQIIGQQGTWSLDVPAIRWKKLSAKPFAGTTVVQTGCWMLLEMGVRNLESGSSFCTWDSCREAWRSCWRGWEHPLADSEPKSGMEAAGCLQRFLLGEYPDQTAPLDFPGARSSSHW